MFRANIWTRNRAVRPVAVLSFPCHGVSANSLKAACLLGFYRIRKSEWVGIRNPMLYPLELRAQLIYH